ncbi:hypothetical protein [Streptomyces lydicus]|uniref:hypothetical protein n=1 Tax=Streptomyces lydicus TaxID=47763 RepID=UPI00131BE608|nr:hypothetical protein [Streptomyces lydicus]
MATVLDLPTRLRGKSTSIPLGSFATSFADDFLAATTRKTGSGFKVQSWWVQAAPSLVIMMVPSSGLAASHEWIHHEHRRFSLWRIYGDESKFPDEIRRLRVYLSRMHSDLMGLDVVLPLCKSRVLDPENKALRDYLDRACSHFLTDQPFGLGVDQYTFLVDALNAFEYQFRDKIEALKVLSGEVESKGLSRKLADAAALLELLEEGSPPGNASSWIYIHIETAQFGDVVNKKSSPEQHFHEQVNAGVISAIIEGDVKGVDFKAASGVSAADIASIVKQLVEGSAALRSSVSAEEADAAQDAAGAVALELTQGEPDTSAIRRRLNTLFSLASKAGAAGGALGGAITALRDALGL